MTEKIALTGNARTKSVSTWEGEHDIHIDWTITPDDDPDVIESNELFTCLGGWAVAWNPFTSNLRGAGPQIRTVESPIEDYHEPNPVYGRLIHVTFEPHLRPEQRMRRVFRVPIVCDDSTAWAAAIEERPTDIAELRIADATSPAGFVESNPDAFPQGDLEKGLMIAVMGPVEAMDLIIPGGDALVVKRHLILSGQFINLLQESRFAAFLNDPDGHKDARWHITLRDHGAGRDILDQDLTLRNDWPGFGGSTLFGAGSEGRFGVFHYALPIEDSFTFGRMHLDFQLGDIHIAYNAEVGLAPMDTLHLPFDPKDELFRDATINFGNGPGEPGGRAQSHNGNPKERYAYDMGVRVNGSNTRLGRSGTLGAFYAFGQTLLATGDGKVIRVEMGAGDAFPEIPNQVPNRVVIEHEHSGGKRYTVFAHCKQNSAHVAVGDSVTAGQPVADIGNNGGSSEPHLHLAYYEFDEWGRVRFLPLAFTVSDGAGGQVTGVPRSNQMLEFPADAGADSNRSLWSQFVDFVVDVGNGAVRTVSGWFVR